MEEQNQTNQNLEQEPQLQQEYNPVPQEQIMPKKNNWVLIIGVVVLFLLLVGGGFAWFLREPNTTDLAAKDTGIVDNIDQPNTPSEIKSTAFNLKEDRVIPDGCEFPIETKFNNTNKLISNAAGFPDWYMLDDGERDSLRIASSCFIFLAEAEDVEAYKQRYNKQNGEGAYEEIYENEDMARQIEKMRQNCLEQDVEKKWIDYAKFLVLTDSDDDGLNLQYEYARNTYDNNKDSDNDGVDDLAESKESGQKVLYSQEYNGIGPNDDYGKYVTKVLIEMTKVHYDDNKNLECYLSMCNSLHWQESHICSQNLWAYYPDDSMCEYEYANSEFNSCKQTFKNKVGFEVGNPEKCVETGVARDEEIQRDIEENGRSYGFSVNSPKQHIQYCLQQHIITEKSLEPCELAEDLVDNLATRFDKCADRFFFYLEDESKCYDYKDKLITEYTDDFSLCLGEQAIKQNNTSLCSGADDGAACIARATGGSQKLCIENGGEWTYNLNTDLRCRLGEI